MIQTLQLFTLISVEKMAPASNCKCAFSLITSCLFSSQVPLPPDLEVWGAGLKFVEVHQAFFKQDWLHQTKLGDSNRLTTKPLSCLFVNVVKYADRERADDSTPAWKTAQSNITRGKCFQVPSRKMSSHNECLLSFPMSLGMYPTKSEFWLANFSVI